MIEPVPIIISHRATRWDIEAAVDAFSASVEPLVSSIKCPNHGTEPVVNFRLVAGPKLAWVMGVCCEELQRVADVRLHRYAVEHPIVVAPAAGIRDSTSLA